MYSYIDGKSTIYDEINVRWLSCRHDLSYFEDSSKIFTDDLIVIELLLVADFP